MRQILRHRVFRASALRLGALVTGVLSSVLISRLGGAEVKGVTSAFAASAILGYTIFNVDLAQQTLRFGRSTETLNATRVRLMRLWPGYGALASLVVTAAALLSSNHVCWLALGTLAYLLSGQMSIACTGLSGPTITAVGGVIQQLGMIAATLVAVASGHLDVAIAPLIILVSFLAPLPLYLWAARPRPEFASRAEPVKARLSGLLGAGLAWQGARLAQLLMLRLDTLVVFGTLGAAAAGVYSVGLATASLAGIIPGQFASNATYEATLKHRSPMRRNLVQAGLSGLGGGVGLAAAGWPLLLLAYGREFSGSYFAMLAALPGIIAYGVLQVFTNKTRLVGRARTVSLPSTVGVVVMGIALLILTPAWGIVGAGVSSSLGAIASLSFVYATSRWRSQSLASART